MLRHAIIASLLLSPTLFAADAPVISGSNGAGAQAAFLALGMGMMVLVVFLYLCYFALFVHLSAKLMSLDKPFGTALKALLWMFVLGIVFGMLTAFIAPRNEVAVLVAQCAASTLGIAVAYDTSIVRSIVVAVLSVILTVLGTFATVFLLTILLSQSPKFG